MPFTQPTVLPSSPPTYSTPSHSDLAAVAATVAVVGVLMAVLLTWLVFRLRRTSNAQSPSIPISVSSRPAPTYTFPSFTTSEKTGSKFGFIRKPGRPTHQHKEGSWDFADPDPFSCPKEIPLDVSPPTALPKYRPVPLTSVPAYTARAHRASMHKDELGPRTPTTPASIIEPPPPAYCPDGYQPGTFSPV